MPAECNNDIHEYSDLGCSAQILNYGIRFAKCGVPRKLSCRIRRHGSGIRRRLLPPLEVAVDAVMLFKLIR